MESTCRKCFIQLDETETTCPRCGAQAEGDDGGDGDRNAEIASPRAADGISSRAANVVSPRTTDVSTRAADVVSRTIDESSRAADGISSRAIDGVPPLSSALADEPASRSRVIAIRAMAIVFAGWLGALAVFAWIAYDQGYVDTLLPLWNTVFFAATLPLVAGIFVRRMWAYRWVVGIAVCTGLSNAWQASKTGSTLLWIGTLLLAAVAGVLAMNKPIFRHDNAHRGTFAQVLAATGMIGSIVVFMTVASTPGTARGRDAFVAEVRGNYEKAGVTTVRVYSHDRTMVIEGSTDTDVQIDQAADMMHAELRKHRSNAKAWALGFTTIKITNGSHTRWLRATDYR